MNVPLAYLNGRYLPFADARLPVTDLGLVQGAVVTERIRTFGFQPFALDAHLARLGRSLAAVGLAPQESLTDWVEIVQRLVEANRPLHSASGDLGIVLFVTPGDRREGSRPTVCGHALPLPFRLWAAKYEVGERLVVPAVRHIPPEVVDPRIKHRSRLHWYLAERAVRAVDPQAAALLLDREGFLTETATGNLLIVQDNRMLTPRPEKTLNGVSQAYVRRLAEEIGLSTVEADLTVEDALGADEVLLSSTSYCLLPVTRIDGRPIGSGRPGQVWRSLIGAWSEHVGIDIVQQARNVAEDEAL